MVTPFGPDTTKSQQPKKRNKTGKKLVNSHVEQEVQRLERSTPFIKEGVL